MTWVDGIRRSIVARKCNCQSRNWGSVNDLAATLAISAYTVSKHLYIRRGAGLITLEKQGQRHVYQLAPEFAAYPGEKSNMLDLGRCEIARVIKRRDASARAGLGGSVPGDRA